MSKKHHKSVPARQSKPVSAPTSDPSPAATPFPVPTPAAVANALEAAIAAVRELTAQRLEAKLSISRLTGVARELRELLKVISVYGV